MKNFDQESIGLLSKAVQTLEEGFTQLPDIDQDLDIPSIQAALQQAADRMQDNYPYHHPLYIGQMLKPPHPVARLAYSLAMHLNPNNHALDGGRASSEMEKQAVTEIARMFGWETFLGHLCGGGTMANFEALWISRELRPGKSVVSSKQAHYTHSRLSGVLGVPFEEIPVDLQGRMDLNELEKALQRGEVGTVVVTMGTTPAGAIDPLSGVIALREEYDFRIHVDAAYGGYFILADNLEDEATNAYALIKEADSIVVDPHKHGLQPYGCGCVLFKDPDVGRFYQHDSTYTYFTSSDLHLGEISLECSRAGASAVALWTTLQVFPLVRGGQFGQSLERCRKAALDLFHWLENDSRFKPLFVPQLDIVVWTVRAPSSSQASGLAQLVFEKAASLDLHLALATFPRSMCEPLDLLQEWDSDHLVCLRACAIKPEHQNWMSQIIERLDKAATEAGLA